MESIHPILVISTHITPFKGFSVFSFKQDKMHCTLKTLFRIKIKCQSTKRNVLVTQIAHSPVDNGDAEYDSSR